MNLKVTVNGIAYNVEVDVDDSPEILPPIYVGGGSGSSSQAAADVKVVTAPLAGSVRKILVKVGQEVRAGDVVAVLEAMKMETEITTTKAGKVVKISAEVGDAVQGGDSLLEIA